MLILFQNIETARSFNDLSSLIAAYGKGIARAIANRMAVLAAADHLGMVPTKGPIRCRPDGAKACFVVDVLCGRELMFTPVRSQKALLALPNGMSRVTEIEIIRIK